MEGKNVPKRGRAARSASVPLPACLDIAHVGELTPLLSDALSRSASRCGARTLAIDASAVELVDSAGMQLLLAFTRALRAQDREVEWKHPPERLRAAAALLGMGEALGLHD